MTRLKNLLVVGLVALAAFFYGTKSAYTASPITLTTIGTVLYSRHVKLTDPNNGVVCYSVVPLYDNIGTAISCVKP